MPSRKYFPEAFDKVDFEWVEEEEELRKPGRRYFKYNWISF